MAKPLVMPNAENCSMSELDVASGATPTKRGHNRLMAMRALILGISHDQVAALFQIDRRTLLNWIHRFNEQGIDGLVDRPRRGRPRVIPAEQTEHLKELIEKPEKAGHTHWTAKKFHGYLRQEFDQEVGYSTVVRWLHENNFSLKVPRSWPDRQDAAKRQAYMEQLQGFLRDTEIDIWYLDETGIEGDPRPRRRWAKKGSKARLPYKGAHLRMNVTGMIRPRGGDFYALEFTHSDTEVFQTFLDHANQDLELERKRNIIICDNATWHKAKSIRWGRFEPAFLPPYSPDLNPIERLWLLIKAEWFSDFIAKDYDDLVQRIDAALCWAIKRKKENQNTCSIKKEL
jgi:transposase